MTMIALRLCLIILPPLKAPRAQASAIPASYDEAVQKFDISAYAKGPACVRSVVARNGQKQLPCPVPDIKLKLPVAPKTWKTDHQRHQGAQLLSSALHARLVAVVIRRTFEASNSTTASGRSHGQVSVSQQISSTDSNHLTTGAAAASSVSAFRTKRKSSCPKRSSPAFKTIGTRSWSD